MNEIQAQNEELTTEISLMLGKAPAWVDRTYKSTDRAKNYTAVVYPDVLSDNWTDILAERFWNVVISPLHEFDVNPDGELKKAHYHILINADNNWITMSELAEVGKILKGIAKPQKASNPVGLIRYMVHLDNPEKYQYQKNDIRVIGSYDIESPFELTKTQQDAVRREIAQYILENNVTELADLVSYAMAERPQWDDLIATKTIYFDRLIGSVRHRGRKNEE